MMVKNNHIIWAAVTIIFILALSMVVLATLDADLTVMYGIFGTAVASILGGLGLTFYQKIDHKIDQVQQQTNGNTMRLQEDLAASHAREVELAKQISPLFVPPATLSNTENIHKS